MAEYSEGSAHMNERSNLVRLLLSVVESKALRFITRVRLEETLSPSPMRQQSIEPTNTTSSMFKAGLRSSVS